MFCLRHYVPLFPMNLAVNIITTPQEPSYHCIHLLAPCCQQVKIAHCIHEYCCYKLFDQYFSTRIVNIVAFYRRSLSWILDLRYPRASFIKLSHAVGNPKYFFGLRMLCIPLAYSTSLLVSVLAFVPKYRLDFVVFTFCLEAS